MLRKLRRAFGNDKDPDAFACELPTPIPVGPFSDDMDSILDGKAVEDEKQGKVGSGGEFDSGPSGYKTRKNVSLDKPKKIDRQMEKNYHAGKDTGKSKDIPSTVDYQVPYEKMKTKHKPVQPEKMKHSKDGPKLDGPLSKARKQRPGERNYKW